MNAIGKSLGLVFLCASFVYGATDATISGTVKDPSGAPFRGAFVQAQNTKTRIYVNVLSDKLGRYQIQGSPALNFTPTRGSLLYPTAFARTSYSPGGKP